MRARTNVLVGFVIAAMTIVAAPVSAHHDDGKGGITPPGMTEVAHELANVVAVEASEESNAPGSAAPCINGMAADTYPCDKVDMLAHVWNDELGLSFVNDMWGWTGPKRTDYAIVGGAEGTAFVDVSDPRRPVVVGLLPTHTTGAFIWRDVKVFDDHAFIVSEDPDHGMQVFDLTQLASATPGTTFTETAYYDGFGSAHNIAINEDTGFAYAVGTQTCDGGLHVVDISTPTSPTFAGCVGEHGYIHDTQCVIYEGPDTEHRGREICFNAAAQFFDFSPDGIVNTLSIVDVTDKNAPVYLANVAYDDDGYSHQGWLTPDQTHFLHGDELDEFFGQVPETATRLWDVTDLDAPYVKATHMNATTSIDHNMYTEGSYVYQANYTTGLRVLSTREVADGMLTEVGYFDVFPEHDLPNFDGGAWSTYPYFAQKKLVAVSSSDRGLFLLQPRVGAS